jgi:hypothetical protein
MRMEKTQNKNIYKRRSFFIRLISGIAGGFAGGNLFSKMIHTTGLTKNNKELQVRINPLAVQRRSKEVTPHGK